MYKYILTLIFASFLTLQAEEGQKWEVILTENLSSIKKLQILDDNTMYACSFRSIMKSTNVGLSWESQYIGTTKPLMDIHFLDENTGWVVGYHGVIVKTTDGGNTWIDLSLPEPLTLSDVCFLNKNTGWICGRGGYISHTTDGGKTWQVVDIGIDKDLTAIEFFDNNTGWIVGGYSDYENNLSYAIILKTTDGGKTWNKLDLPFGVNTFALHIVDENNVWIGGVHGIINRTSDGGETWVNQRTNIDKPIFDIEVIDQNTAYAVGGWGSTEGFGIGQAGGGIKAKRVEAPKEKPYAEEHDVSQIFTKNDTRDYPMGGLVFKTVDGGENWVPTAWFKDIDLLSGIEISSNGTVYVTTGNKGKVLRLQK